jgi:malto-oligosyltrehalose trehalohydrolase
MASQTHTQVRPPARVHAGNNGGNLPPRPSQALTARKDSRRRSHAMPFGAELQEDGAVRFRLWAPKHGSVRLDLEGSGILPMQAIGNGWHELVTDRARAGSRYRFVLPDGLRVPDPASRFQPEDVHGPSEVIDPRTYQWQHAEWRGRPFHEAIIYELHVGAFTPEGTFRAACDKLDHLVALGVTAIQIMPIADFPGTRNWGYDGVLPFAPESSYGRPEDLKALIDAAHGRGLMVFLDVVYNHFGPDGNYLPAYAPIFTDRHKTPWGGAINYDAPDSGPVREIVLHNALYWITEFQFDGLRLDAVHAIVDESPKHLLEEMAERVRSAAVDRPVHLIVENEENEARWLGRDADLEPHAFTAQWNDDVHHGLHVAATGESSGYYVEYSNDPSKLPRALAEGFAFQGELMEYRGHPRGEASAHLPPTAFISFIQNHDQVGNRAFGDRLTASAPDEAVRAIAAIYLLAPQIPMLFMGEEWAAAQPFPFFCDFSAPLSDAVRDGRRAEFARFPEFQDPATRNRIPDPTAAKTFGSAKLRWEDSGRPPHAAWLDWYRRLLSARRQHIVPRLRNIAGDAGRYRIVGPNAFVVSWTMGDGSQLHLAANLRADRTGGFPAVTGDPIWTEGQATDDQLAPWTVLWRLQPPTQQHG